MSLLVTGFGPFLDVVDNPSARIASRLDGTRIHGLEVHARVLPVSFDRAAAELKAAVAELRPSVLLLLGVHRGDTWRLETRATPVITSEHPDADACLGTGRALGPSERRTALDVGGLAAELGGAGHEVAVSDDCGGYVCNSTYFAALDLRHDALFLHVPDLGEPGIARGAALVRAILERVAGRAAEGQQAASVSRIDWVDDPEARYRLHLLALGAPCDELLPGYRRAEERIRPRLPKLDLGWQGLADALTEPAAPSVDREWFATRDAAEAPAIARSISARRPPASSPFASLPEAHPLALSGVGARIVVSGAARPEPALVPAASTVVCGYDTPTALAWLAAVSLPFAARLAEAVPGLPTGPRRFAALMLGGAAYAVHLPSADLDALLEAIVSTLLPPQHRGAETIAWLEACREAGLLPEHPGEFERMCHGIPRRRHDRVHRAWVRGSFRAP